MKVLWVTNALLPEAIAKMGRSAEVKGTGGWIMALANALHEIGDIDIHFAAISELVTSLTIIEGENITYHVIPRGKGDVKYNPQYEEYYQKIVGDIQPDIVHIHGSELPHSLAALRACGVEKTVVSLQGLVSVIARYNNGGISNFDALKNLTIHDIVRGGIIRNKKYMYKSGEIEAALLSEVKYVIGRTSFDRQHLWALNPEAKYFHCDELLRSEFYDSDGWSYSNCIPHSIFMSQSAFPIKGVHKVIEALAIVVNHYPDVQLRVAGQDLLYYNGGIKGRLRLTGYGHYVRKVIAQCGLKDKIQFTGPLNADGMIREYLKANVFICPSSIENSPNSLAEAQLLGVPCLGSFAGGIPDLMKGNEENLYRFEEVEMLAYKICDIFRQKGDVQTEEIRLRTMKRHDRTNVVKTLVDIYNTILNG